MRFFSSTAAWLLVCSSAAWANNVHNVELNRDYATINSAMADEDLAAGQTLVISPGTYNESVNVDISVTLKSNYETDPSARENTIIIGGPGLPGFDMTAGTLLGLTVTGSRTGVYAGGDTIIQDCVIRDNISGTYASGGVYAYESAQVLFNIVRHNAPCGVFGTAQGGGVFAGDDALVMGNLIEDNFGFCENPVDGGGDEAEENATPRGGGLLDGGGLYLADNARAISNVIRNNIAAYGGGVSTCCGTNVLINNTITGNTGWIYGGAIINWGAPAGAIANNIIAYHSGKAIEDFGVPSNMFNNLFFGNTGGNGSTGTSPVFADPLLNFDGIHLQEGSPAVDAGASSYVLPGEFDIDEAPRVQQVAVDIGADETGILLAHNLTSGLDYYTIQSAIDAAGAGDEIAVDPGTHHERLIFFDKAILVRCLDPMNAETVADTIIDGGGADSVVQMSAGEISGFTIQNGFGLGPKAGGVEANGSAIVSHNIITSNFAEQRGGGVSATDSAIVQYNHIVGNGAGNRAGGVSARDNAIVIDNVISDNYATVGGGGVRAQEFTVIRNNTLVGNSSEETGTGVNGGGGILAEDSALLLNNIVAFSTDGVGIHVPDGNAVTADYNCVYANADGNYGGEAVAGAHDLNTDPLLNLDNEHLLAESPCINTGDPITVIFIDETDLDLEARIQGVHIDIGADETPAPPACDGDANGDASVDPLDAGYVLARLGCDVSAGGKDCVAADQNHDGVVDPLDMGYVLARLGICGR